MSWIYSPLPGAGLSSRLSFSRTDDNERAKVKCSRKPLNQDGNSSTQAAVLRALLTLLTHCVKVLIAIENRSANPQGVTVLYVDASFGISALWPIGGKSNRIAYGKNVDIPIQIVTRPRSGKKLATGRERIVVFSVPVDENTANRTVLAAHSKTDMLKA